MRKEKFNHLLHLRKYLYSYSAMPIQLPQLKPSIEPYVLTQQLGQDYKNCYMLYRFKCENILLGETDCWRGNYLTDISEHSPFAFTIEITRGGTIVLHHMFNSDKHESLVFYFRDDFNRHLMEDKNYTNKMIEKYRNEIHRMTFKNNFNDIIQARLATNEI